MAATNEKDHPIKLLLNVKSNKVAFAHAGKDFVDALLSFLTLPLGTIVRLLAKESNIISKDGFGSLSTLYESVVTLEEKHFWSETCKEMLLRPRNAAEAYCQNLKLNIDDTETMKYFICQNWNCSRQPSGGLLSTFKNKRCTCGELMNREISPRNGKSGINENGFVTESIFIVTDDLKVMPENFQASNVLLEIEDYYDIKEVMFSFTPSMMIELLKFSLVSKTPLTDLVMMMKGRKIFIPPRLPLDLDFKVGKQQHAVAGKPVKVKVKIVLRKSDAKILFALGEEDFVDFLFSFLTFPLGMVEHLLKGNSCLGSIDNMYKSIVGLDGYKYLKSAALKEKLIHCRLAHQFKLKHQTIPIVEEPASLYSCYSKSDFLMKYSGNLSEVEGYNKYKNKIVYAPLRYLEPQSSIGKIFSNDERKGFTKGPSLYMITDNLDVTPHASISAISLLASLRIPPEDLEERTIIIGMEEGLSILKASMISSSALTNGLGPLIKPIQVPSE